MMTVDVVAATHTIWAHSYTTHSGVDKMTLFHLSTTAARGPCKWARLVNQTLTWPPAGARNHHTNAARIRNSANWNWPATTTSCNLRGDLGMNQSQQCVSQHRHWNYHQICKLDCCVCSSCLQQTRPASSHMARPSRRISHVVHLYVGQQTFCSTRWLDEPALCHYQSICCRYIDIHVIEWAYDIIIDRIRTRWIDFAYIKLCKCQTISHVMTRYTHTEN